MGLLKPIRKKLLYFHRQIQSTVLLISILHFTLYYIYIHNYYVYVYVYYSEPKLQKDLEEFKDLTLKDFTYVGTLGMGGFGRVELVSVYTFIHIQ